MENRYKLPKGIQRNYLLQLEKISGFSGDKLARLFGIVGRSYRDWRREKYTITEKAVEIIEETWKLQLPFSKTKAKKYWIKNKLELSRKGGLTIVKKYGGPGTPEGRSKGGKHAIAILRARGIIPPPKPFHAPKKFSGELAEFVGILLGDGHIGKEQWSITLNSIADIKYVNFVNNLINSLFGFKPGIYKRKNMNAIVISGSSINSIKYLQSIELMIGNKVKQQVGVPSWIYQNPTYRISCLRGLMDTDGGVFVHRYKVNGKEYIYKKICFVNRSIPLLNFVYETFEKLNFHPKIIMKVENKRVWLYNQTETEKYLELVSTHNPRLLRHQL